MTLIYLTHPSTHSLTCQPKDDDVDEEEARFRHEDACRCEEGNARYCTFIEWALKDGVPIPDAE